MGHKKCEQGKRKTRCIGAMKHIISSRMKGCGLTNRSLSNLGCDIPFYINYVENQFTNEMTWDNYGNIWVIDHIVPFNWNNPTEQDLIGRCHYTNTQPLLKLENETKRNQLRSEDVLKILSLGCCNPKIKLNLMK